MNKKTADEQTNTSKFGIHALDPDDASNKSVQAPEAPFDPNLTGIDDEVLDRNPSTNTND